jgi:hypothetical protein
VICATISLCDSERRGLAAFFLPGDPAKLTRFFLAVRPTVSLCGFNRRGLDLRGFFIFCTTKKPIINPLEEAQGEKRFCYSQ